jgi:hypothetical protein
VNWVAFSAVLVLAFPAGLMLFLWVLYAIEGAREGFVPAPASSARRDETTVFWLESECLTCDTPRVIGRDTCPVCGSVYGEAEFRRLIDVWELGE